MEEIIKIEEKDGRKAVNARELHQFLENKRQFADWIKQRVEQYGFIENKDFEVFHKFVNNSNGGRPTVEYALSIEMAKELSMVENNEKGRIARKYFIACEEKLKQGVLVMPNFSNPAEAARAWADQYEQRLKLEAKAREDAPKVEFFESVAESKDAVEMKAVSSTLNYVAVGRNKLFAILREQKVLQSNNIPYQKYIDAGYFRTIETKKNCGTEVRIFIKTLVYQKGLDYIRKLLNKLGYRPKENKEQTSLEFKG
jgi:anti-repressor protein